MDILTDVEFWHWFALAGMLGIMEIVAPGFVLIWLSLAAALTGVIILFWQNMPFTYQLLVFASLSVLSVIFWLSWLKRYPAECDRPNLNRRTKQVIGRRAVVVDAVINGRGRIRLGDSTWSVTGQDMPAGSMVVITGANGPILEVKPISSD